VMAEVSVPSLPCKKNAQWFRDRDFTRMHHEREPGVSRMYASVLHGGRLRPGDQVRLEPTEA
jgi:MOSC domain-containing protein YiiM